MSFTLYEYDAMSGPGEPIEPPNTRSVGHALGTAVRLGASTKFAAVLAGGDMNVRVSTDGATATSDDRSLMAGEALAFSVLQGARPYVYGIEKGAIVPLEIRFGALTPAGFGGYPTTGTTIAAGDPSGHFVVAGGYLTPSIAGAAAGLNLGPYSLVMDTGRKFTVNVLPNAYHVRAVTGAQDEWNGTSGVAKLSAATLAGKTIYLRAGSSFDPNIVSGGIFHRLNFGGAGSAWKGLVIESDDLNDKAVFTTRIWLSCQYLTIRGVKWTPSIQQKIILNDSEFYPVTDIIIDQCECPGLPRGWLAADYPAIATYSTNFINEMAITSNFGSYISNVRVTNNVFRYVKGLCSLGSKTGLAGSVSGVSGGHLVPEALTVSSNLLDVYWAVGIQVSVSRGALGPVYVENNEITRCVSVASDTGNPHQDAIGIFANNGSNPTSGVLSDLDVHVNGNVVLHCGARGSPAPIALRDFKASGIDSGYFFTGEIRRNIVDAGSSEGILVSNAKAMVVTDNTVVSHRLDAAGYRGNILIAAPSADSTSSGVHVLERNLCEALTAAGTPTLSNNTQLGYNDAANYAAALTGPDYLAVSRADALAKLTPDMGGPADLGGGIVAGAITLAGLQKAV